jgi:hypothetical protein
VPNRNDPCPCGSGKKYKKCCLKKDAEQRTGLANAQDGERWLAAGEAALHEHLDPLLDRLGSEQRERLQNQDIEDGSDRDSLPVLDMLDHLRVDAAQKGEFERFEELVSTYAEEYDALDDDRLTGVLELRALNALAGGLDCLPAVLDGLLVVADPMDIEMSSVTDALRFHGDGETCLGFSESLMEQMQALLGDDEGNRLELESDHRVARLVAQVLSAPDGKLDRELEMRVLEIQDGWGEPLNGAILNCLRKVTNSPPRQDAYAVEKCKRRTEVSDDDDDAFYDDLFDLSTSSGWRFSVAGAAAMGDAGWRFSYWLVQTRGVPWPRAWLGIKALLEYFTYSVEHLYPPSAEEDASLRDPLVPDAAFVREFLLAGEDSATAYDYDGAAMAASTPHWLDYLVEHGLLAPEARDEARESLKPVIDHYIAALELQSGDPLMAAIVRQAWA